MLDFFDLWHARLGHVSVSYIKKMRNHGLISGIKNSYLNKCEVCIESKSTKKSCFPVQQRESKLHGLIHMDLGDLK